MAEVIRAGLVQQQWTGDKDSMIRASVDAIGRAASAGAQVVCLQELFYGPYFCQVQDADYYSYTEADPGRVHHPAHVRPGPAALGGAGGADVRGGAARALLQHRGRDRRRRQLPGQVPEDPPAPGEGLLGEVLLPAGQPRLPGVRHRGRPDRRVHLLRPALPGGLAGARPGRRADRVQPVGDQPRPVPVPVAAGAARRGGGQRVLRRRDQPGRRGAAGRQRVLRPVLLRRPARPAGRRGRLGHRRRGGRPRPEHGRAGRGARPVAVLPGPPPRPVRRAGRSHEHHGDQRRPGAVAVWRRARRRAGGRRADQRRWRPAAASWPSPGRPGADRVVDATGLLRAARRHRRAHPHGDAVRRHVLGGHVRDRHPGRGLGRHHHDHRLRGPGQGHLAAGHAGQVAREGRRQLRGRLRLPHDRLGRQRHARSRRWSRASARA